jgi:hypothetical protein
MKKFILFLGIALLAFTTYAQEAKIEFKKDTIDYGVIKKGSDGVRIFTFTNTGDAPLVITGVKSSCGCTIPEKPKQPIQPGAEGVIKVKYDTNRVGEFFKTTYVSSNAGGTKKIIIKGRVENDQP